MKTFSNRLFTYSFQRFITSTIKVERYQFSTLLLSFETRKLTRKKERNCSYLRLGFTGLYFIAFGTTIKERQVKQLILIGHGTAITKLPYITVGSVFEFRSSLLKHRVFEFRAVKLFFNFISCNLPLYSAFKLIVYNLYTINIRNFRTKTATSCPQNIALTVY